MNVLFLTISELPNLEGHSISIDLMHEFVRNGHNVFVVGAASKDSTEDTKITKEAGCTALRVKIGDNKKANPIKKGITTVTMPKQYIRAIEKYLEGIKFDAILYPTPPVTLVKTVEHFKKRDGAKTYLLLKDIFPQNAVDIGMLSKKGVKGNIYKYFRRQEKLLYAISDRIGCMSEANVQYILNHNSEINSEKVEVCPNSIEFIDKTISSEQRDNIRKKYNLPTDKKIFVYGGNLGKPQGIPFLMKCLEKERGNNDVLFFIVGAGTEYTKLENFINKNDFSNVRLMARLPKEDYDILVSSCDVGMIFLDHRFTIPNFPSRLLSYMQAGLPVFACTDSNSDIGEVITKGKFGWWCESNDVNQFAKTVDLISKSDLIHIGLNGKKYLIDNYTVQKQYLTINKFLGG